MTFDARELAQKIAVERCLRGHAPEALCFYCRDMTATALPFVEAAYRAGQEDAAKLCEEKVGFGWPQDDPNGGTRKVVICEGERTGLQCAAAIRARIGNEESRP